MTSRRPPSAPSGCVPAGRRALDPLRKGRVLGAAMQRAHHAGSLPGRHRLWASPHAWRACVPCPAPRSWRVSPASQPTCTPPPGPISNNPPNPRPRHPPQSPNPTHPRSSLRPRRTTSNGRSWTPRASTSPPKGREATPTTPPCPAGWPRSQARRRRAPPPPLPLHVAPPWPCDRPGPGPALVPVPPALGAGPALALRWPWPGCCSCSDST